MLFRVYYYGLKRIKGEVAGVKGLTVPLGQALNPNYSLLIHFKPK